MACALAGSMSANGARSSGVMISTGARLLFALAGLRPFARPRRRVRLPTGWAPGLPVAEAGVHLDLLGRHRHPRPEPRREQLHRRSEEHTSELQSRGHLVCRLLLEKKE